MANHEAGEVPATHSNANNSDQAASKQQATGWFTERLQWSLAAALLGSLTCAFTITVALQPSTEAEAAATSETVERPDTGKWSVSRSTNPMTDNRIASVVLYAEGSYGSAGQGIFLAIQCNQNGAPVFVHWNKYLAPTRDGDYLTKNLLVRFGSDVPKEETWSVLSDQTTTAKPVPYTDFVMSMRKVDRLVMQIEPYNENPVSVSFDLHGLTEALKQGRPECDWHLRDVIQEEIQAKKRAVGYEARGDAIAQPK